jgi:ABC-type Fe3+ transport system permease subunit
MRSINPEMEEAVRILGGGRLLAIRKVLAPLLKRSLAGAWILVFIPATRELSTAMFLYGPKTRTMSVMLMDMSEEGNFENLAALGFLLLASTLVIVGLAPACWGVTSCCGGSGDEQACTGRAWQVVRYRAGGAGYQPDTAGG